jgi:arylsulfatase A-like enzyme
VPAASSPRASARRSGGLVSRLLAFLVFVPLLTTGCGAAHRPPNVVLISIDSLRADHLGVYGYGRDTSPHLDALAKRSVVFDHAFSTTTWTLPSHASLLSGLYPNAHGVTRRNLRIPEAVPLLPELLATRGYRSAAVVSTMFLHRRYGFDQGWVDYRDDIVGPDRAMHSLISSPLVHERALQLLDELGGGPFLLFAHYFDVHYDYIPPSPWNTRFDPDYKGSLDGRNYATSTIFRKHLPARDLEHIEALYDGEIRWTDEWLGKLFAELERRGILDDAVVVVLADHGDEFYDHGHLGHAKNLYDSTLHVPLIVHFPGDRWAGRRVSTPVSLVDVAPTILAAAGIAAPADWPGRDLAQAFGGHGLPAVPVFADLRYTSIRRAAIDGDWKAIFTFRRRQSDPAWRELYDLATDPKELHDRSADDPDRVDSLWRRLATRQREDGQIRLRFGRSRIPRDEAAERQLKALGYL